MRIVPLIAVALSAAAAEPFSFMAQYRAPDASAADGYGVVQERVEWAPEQTAVIVCDMWDRHWCVGATRRVGEMAPRMNQVLQSAREAGALIIHAPSGVTDFYADTPQRLRAEIAPHADMPNPDSWKSLDLAAEPPLPIDDSDGGCNCLPQCPEVNKSVWTRQHPALSIGPDDVISDSGQEIYNVLEAEGRDNVIIMGVHTNMCVLGRPFSIRAQVQNGKNVVLMRDLTDTMYNARMAPYVDHFRGTDLVLEHIEKYWCPTLTSSAFIAGPPFSFAEDARVHAVFLLHEDEYETEDTVPDFAEVELAGRLGWKCTYLTSDRLHSIPGTAALADADLMFVSVRRQVLDESEFAPIRDYVASGKPIVGIRTASHAFASRKGRGPDSDGVEWPEFDGEFLGGNYHGHTDNKAPDTPRTMVWNVASAAGHPILEGMPEGPWQTTSWLYLNAPVAPSARVLMMGSVGNDQAAHPVTWTNTGKHGNRVFYTSLGHQDDFNDPRFRQLLLNGILWATGESTSGSTDKPTGNE